MMRTKFLLFCLVLVFCPGLAGCGNDNGNSPAAATDNEATSVRWNAYVALSNESDDLMSVLSSYAENVGHDSEPQTDRVERFAERIDHNTQFLNKVQEFTAAALEQVESSQQTELDKSVKAFAENINKSMTLQQEAAQYYGAKSHVDDQMTKGKEMHPKVVAAYDELASAYDFFSDLMNKEDRLNILRDVQEMRDEGQKAQPALLEFLVVAQNVADKLPPDDVTVPDSAALQPDYDLMVKALAELQAAAADDAILEEELLDKERMQQLAKAAGELKAIVTSQLELAVKGEPAKKTLVSTDQYMMWLNTYIRTYNYLIDSQRNKSYNN